MIRSSQNSTVSSHSSKHSNRSFVDSAYSDSNLKPMNSPLSRPFQLKSPKMGHSGHSNNRYGGSRPMTNGSLSSQSSVRSNRSNSNVSNGSHGQNSISSYGGMAMVSPRIQNIPSPISHNSNNINPISMDIKNGNLPPKKIIKAIHSYTSNSPKELSFKEGDFFFVIQEMENHYLVCNPLEKTQGLVPRDCFDEVEKKKNAINIDDTNVNNGGKPSLPLPKRQASKLSQHSSNSNSRYSDRSENSNNSRNQNKDRRYDDDDCYRSPTGSHHSSGSRENERKNYDGNYRDNYGRNNDDRRYNNDRYYDDRRDYDSRREYDDRYDDRYNDRYNDRYDERYDERYNKYDDRYDDRYDDGYDDRRDYSRRDYDRDYDRDYSRDRDYDRRDYDYDRDYSRNNEYSRDYDRDYDRGYDQDREYRDSYDDRQYDREYDRDYNRKANEDQQYDDDYANRNNDAESEKDTARFTDVESDYDIELEDQIKTLNIKTFEMSKINNALSPNSENDSKKFNQEKKHIIGFSERVITAIVRSSEQKIVDEDDNEDMVYQLEIFKGDGQCYILYRTYKDFQKLIFSLIDQYPEEAGLTANSRRVLPYLLPKDQINQSILDSFLQFLVQQPQNVQSSPAFIEFFEVHNKRKEGDIDDSYYNGYDDEDQDHVKENARNFSVFFDTKDEDIKNGNLFGPDKEGIKVKFVCGKDIFAVRVNSNITYENLLNKAESCILNTESDGYIEKISYSNEFGTDTKLYGNEDLKMLMKLAYPKLIFYINKK